VRFLHFAFLATGEGDAAGEGLAAGVVVVAGAVPVGLLDDAEGDGDDVTVAGVELLLVSVAQPTANTVARIIGNRSVVLPINFNFGSLISFCLVRARLKSRRMIARTWV
jgi:hypothetical protein